MMTMMMVVMLWGRTPNCQPPSHTRSSMLLHNRSRLSPAHLSVQEYSFCLSTISERKWFPFFLLFFRQSKSKQVVPSALHHTLSAQSSAFTSVFTLMGADLSAYLFQIFSHGKHGEYKSFVVTWGNHREGVYEPPYSPSCHLLRLMKLYSCL